jgi:predicted enzyme related to lactoylglutathione lyase
MTVGSFLFITIDCTDPVALAGFWSQILGTEVDTQMDGGRFVFLKGNDSLPVVCFQRVPESKAGKSRIHLDLSVADLAAATRRVVELGGTWPDGVERQLEGFTWRTVTDPEGNEFDLALA